MRVIKPQRLSVLQRVFEVQGERRLCLVVAAYLPFEAPEVPLPEASMWQVVPKQLGRDAALDEVLPKPRGEVLMFGTAYAPGGVPRPAFQVRVQVGAIDKVAYVVGQRRWSLGGSSDPEPLTSLQLGWDKAFGGKGVAANPLGVGAAPIEQDGKKVHPLPQIEDPKHLIKAPDDKPAPWAFGALDPMWPARKEHAGTYDQAWLEQDFPGFARDLHPDYFMVAPLDQRLPGFFAGGEPILCENLHEGGTTLESRVTTLVAKCFVAKTTLQGDTFEEVGMRLDTIVLLPNVRRQIALFRGVVGVKEADGADVSCLVAALESRDAPRTLEHYRTVYTDRLDKKKGLLVALREGDLLPPVDKTEQKRLDEKPNDMEELLTREGIFEKRAREKAQRELDKMRLSLHVLGIDPDEKGIAKQVPPPEEAPDFDNLPAYIEKVQAEADRIEQEAKAKQEEALENARKSLAEQGVDLDEAMEKGKKEGAGPPKFRAEAHLEAMRETARASRAMGAEMQELEAQIEDPAFQQKLFQMEQTQLLTYRTIAHLQLEAPLPDDDTRTSQRARVQAAITAEEPMTGWDLTGADLSRLDLSKAVFRDALLERADFTGATLDGADFEGAVLARARLDGVKARAARFVRANMGESTARGAFFDDANFEKAVLMRATLDNASFARAQLTGADLFETSLSEANLEGVTANEVLFYECELDRARFDGASLKKATFFRASLLEASFADATVEGSGFVEVRADKVSFARAKANNLRFVLACGLEGANFTNALLGMATVRELTLVDACFEGVKADGSDFSGSDMAGANLRGASLRGARFIRSNLDRASFEGAMMMEAMLQSAKIHGTSFLRANLFQANFMDAIGDNHTSFSDAHLARVLFSRRR